MGAISTIDNLTSDETTDCKAITAYIEGVVGASRRVFKEVPAHLTIKSQLFDRGAWFVSFGIQELDDIGGFVIAPCLGDKVLIFGTLFNRNDLNELESTSSSSNVVIPIPRHEINRIGGIEISISGKKVWSYASEFFYPDICNSGT